MASAETRKGTGFDGPAVTLGVLAALVFAYALSLFLQGGFLATRNLDREVKLTATDDPLLAQVELEQTTLLEGPARWLDAEKTKAAIPIEDAMRLVVEREGGDREGE